MRSPRNSATLESRRRGLLDALLVLLRQCAAGAPLHAVGKTSAELLLSLFTASAAQVMLRREETGRLEMLAYAGTGREALGSRTLALDEGIAPAVLEQAEPLYVPDIQSDPRWVRRDEAGASGLRSAFLAPLRLDAEPVGLIEVYDPEMGPEGPSPEDKDALMAFADHAAGAIRGAQDRQQVEDESERLRVVLDSIPLPAVVIRGERFDQAIIDLQNRASVQAAGTAFQPGLPLREVAALYHTYPPDHSHPYALHEVPILRALERGETITQEEVHVRRPSGEWRVMLASAAPTRRSGRVTGAVLVFEEITDRVREEEEVRRRYAQLSVIYELATSVSQAEDLAQIYEVALDSLIHTQGAERASILLLDPDGVMRFKAWRGLSERYRLALEGHSPWPPDARDPQPVLIPEVEDSSGLEPHLGILREEGIRALAFIPLVHRHRLMGKFMIYHGKPHEFSDEEVQVAQTIAYHIAFAIERKQAADALKASESSHRMLMEEASDPIIIMDADGDILSANTRAVELAGYTEAEMTRMNVAELVTPEDLREHPLRLPELRAGKMVVSERPIRRKDGAVRLAEISAKLLPDGRLQAIARDITEQERNAEAQRFLAEASSVLSSSLDYQTTLSQVARLAVPALADWCFVYIFDASVLHRTEVAWADPADEEVARKLASFPTPSLDAVCRAVPQLCAGEALLLDRIPPDILKTIARSLEHLAAIQAIGAQSAMVVPMKVRERLLGLINIVSTRSGRRYTDRDLALAKELGYRAALAMENARLYRDAQAANRAKDQFLAVLSHELRNPLAPIIAGVDVLRRTVTEGGRVHRTIEIIDRNARLQSRLVNDLLDLSRIARGKVELRCVTVALDTVVRAAIQGQESDLEEAGLTLRLELQTGLWVKGDLDRLQQVVMNLLSNAIKFTPAAGEIRVECKATGTGHARIVVEDTGIGITPELLPNLFQMFEQGGVEGRRAAGLGIGLALVRALVEKHGGSVTAESEGPGKGSRFTVELPLVPAPETTPAGKTPRTEPQHLRVLIIEDNPDTREMLATALDISGYAVTSASSGEEALERVQEERPDIILADIGLPGMDGYEFLQRAREQPAMADVPALALTGFGQESDIRHAHEAGFAEHLVKPVDLEALETRIRELTHADGETPAKDACRLSTVPAEGT